MNSVAGCVRLLVKPDQFMTDLSAPDPVTRTRSWPSVLVMETAKMTATKEIVFCTVILRFGAANLV